MAVPGAGEAREDLPRRVVELTRIRDAKLVDDGVADRMHDIGFVPTGAHLVRQLRIRADAERCESCLVPGGKRGTEFEFPSYDVQTAVHDARQEVITAV